MNVTKWHFLGLIKLLIYIYNFYIIYFFVICVSIKKITNKFRVQTKNVLNNPV